MYKLSKREKNKLNEFTSEFKNLRRFDQPKHNCLGKKPKKKPKFVFEMELRAKSEPKYFTDEENSAHQFSVRSKSIQVDCKQREEIAM